MFCNTLVIWKQKAQHLPPAATVQKQSNIFLGKIQTQQIAQPHKVNE